MRRNIMEALNATPDGEAPKNGFPLGNFVDFHQKGGQFNVVGMRKTVPNSDYRMSVDGFTRTLPCNTANFAHIKENYYFIHVPLGLVSRNAYQTLVNRKQAYSAIDMGIEQFPVFSLGTVLKQLIDGAHADPSTPGTPWFDIHGFNIALGAVKLFDMVGLGNYADIFEWTFHASGESGDTTAARIAIAKLIFKPLESKYVNANALCAYQCAWYHFFRNDVYDNQISAKCFNLDDVTVPSGGVVDYDILHHRNVIDFITDCCQLRYVGYKKDIFMSGMPGTQYGPVSTVTSFFNSSSSGVRLFKNGLNSGVAIDHLKSSNSNGLILAYDSDNAYQGEFQTRTEDGSYSRSVFDVLSLVESQAIQKWRQKSMLAGNKTADQFRAHHGEVPKHLLDHLPDFIGSVDNEIHITEITSQADTASDPSESNLGEIAGRGYGVSDSKVFNFHSDDYGILFLIHAIVPENTYSSFGIDDINTMIYYNDFYQEEYQNIGLQPVPKYLLNALDHPNGSVVPSFRPHPSDGGDTITSDVGIFSYAPRNFSYKEYPSKVHGFLNPTRQLSVYTGQGSVVPVPIFEEYGFGFSDMASFVMPRRDMVLDILVNDSGGDDPDYDYNSLAFTLSNLYVHPSIFDSIFNVVADSSQVTDEFITHLRFNCDASLPMSVLGLPKF